MNRLETPANKKTAVGPFFLFVFLISWLGWIPAALFSRGLFPFNSAIFNILGIAGPTIAAVLAVAWETAGKAERDQALSRVFSWRTSLRWYGLAVLLPVVFVAVGMGIFWVLGRGLPDFGLLPLTAVPGIVAGWILTSTWEEIGWRGYALPRLQQHFGPLAATVILGLVWGLWHLPLHFTLGETNAQLPLWLNLINGVVASVIYTWLYNRSGQITGPVAIYHSLSNVMATVWLTTMADFQGQYLVYTVIIAAAALGLLVQTRGRLGWR